MDEIFFDYATKEYVEMQCAAIRSEIYAHAGGGGSGGEVMVVNVGTDEDFKDVIEMPASELYEASQSGIVIVKKDTNYNHLIAASIGHGEYVFVVAGGRGWSPDPFIAASSSDYPTSG